MKTKSTSRENMKRLNAKCHRQAGEDKDKYFEDACIKIESDNRVGITRDLFEKIREITGKFWSTMGVVKV